MKHMLVIGAVLFGLASSFAPCAAKAAEGPGFNGPPPSISVSASGSVKYAPDIAHVSFGVRAQSQAATDAAAQVNTRAQAVVKELRGMGISDADIKTSGYTLDFQQNDSGMGGSVSNGPLAGEPHRPISLGYYVATESIDVTVSVSQAGAALDGAVKAGANETYGLSYDTSQRDRLYRQALAAGVSSARAQAVALAAAAGVQLGSIIAISTGGGGGPMPMQGRMMMMGASAVAPPVLGGTDTIDATVSVIYAIKP
ncbi:MAG TPA: SIMPL domain-containing protein [Candidatus Eremiobacteraceae bacterium]